MQDYKEIQFKNQTIQISFHAELRMKERFGNEFKLEDALGRGKTLNTDNVKMFPWLCKLFINFLRNQGNILTQITLRCFLGCVRS